MNDSNLLCLLAHRIGVVFMWPISISYLKYLLKSPWKPAP